MSPDRIGEAAFDASLRALDARSSDPILPTESPSAGILGEGTLDAATIYRNLLQETNGGGKSVFKAGRARILDDDLAGLLAWVAKEEEPSEIQVVCLAFGFCTRSYRLKKGWRPSACHQVGLVWFDVEPSAAAEKRRSLSLQIPLPKIDTRNVALSLESCSVSDLVQGLKLAGFNSLAPTIFVLEGVLSTWNLDRAVSFLIGLSNNSGPSSKILATLSSDNVVGKDPNIRLGAESLMKVGRLESTGWGRAKLSADISEVVRSRYRRELMPRYPLFSSPSELTAVTEVEQVLQVTKL